MFQVNNVIVKLFFACLLPGRFVLKLFFLRFSPAFAGDKRNYVCNEGLRIIFPSHLSFTFKNVRVVKSARSVSFTHTSNLSKFILDVAFMRKKKE